MIRSLLFVLLSSISAFTVSAQELFPLTEPASTIPDKAIAVRLTSQAYEEPGHYLRDLSDLKVEYGILPKLTVMLSGSVANHHNKELPPEFPAHNTPQIGVPHPYRFNGFDLYAKYRFLSLDGEHKHFRMALFGEASALWVAHDEAEPTLMDDTKGISGGAIATYLNHRFAVSFTGGFIHPFRYKGDIPDFIAGLPSVPTQVQYGNAAIYDVSFGYLLLPRKYESYNQTNWNLYVEFLGKSYTAAQVSVANILTGGYYPISATGIPVLQAGNYVDVNPGIQCIIRSNLRAEFSVGFPVIDRSYVHYYPLYTIGVQRYFFSRRKEA